MVLGLMNGELGEKITKENVTIRLSMYSYLTEQLPYRRWSCWQESQGHKEGCNKVRDKIQGLQNMSGKWLFLRTQQRFRSETLNVFTEKVNKMALSANDNRRI